MDHMRKARTNPEHSLTGLRCNRSINHRNRVHLCHEFQIYLFLFFLNFPPIGLLIVCVAASAGERESRLWYQALKVAWPARLSCALGTIFAFPDCQGYKCREKGKRGEPIGRRRHPRMGDANGRNVVVVVLLHLEVVEAP